MSIWDFFYKSKIVESPVDIEVQCKKNKFNFNFDETKTEILVCAKIVSVQHLIHVRIKLIKLCLKNCILHVPDMEVRMRTAGVKTCTRM